LEWSPRKSRRRFYEETDLSWASVMCIMHKDLHLFPYKIQILLLQTNARLRDIPLGKALEQYFPSFLGLWFPTEGKYVRQPVESP